MQQKWIIFLSESIKYVGFRVNKLVKLVIIFAKLDSLTFVKFRNCFDKKLPKEKM